MQAAFTASLYDIRVSPQNLAAVPCYVSIIAVTRRKLNQQKCLKNKKKWDYLRYALKCAGNRIILKYIIK